MLSKLGLLKEQSKDCLWFVSRSGSMTWQGTKQCPGMSSCGRWMSKHLAMKHIGILQVLIDELLWWVAYVSTCQRWGKNWFQKMLWRFWMLLGSTFGLRLWRYRQANMKHSVFKSKQMDPVVFATGSDRELQELQSRVSVLQCQHVASF